MKVRLEEVRREREASGVKSHDHDDSEFDKMMKSEAGHPTLSDEQF